MNDDIKASIITGIIFVIIFGTAFFFALFSNRQTCRQRFVAFENKYGFFAGCLIKINNKWIPDEAYYVKEETK